MNYETRMLATSVYTPYVKISEGCNNRCAFCAIPLIRGVFRSRFQDEILSEVRLLIQNGAKEINLISQDTTRYGTDLTKDHQPLLVDLLQKITQIDGLMMVRILYLYPDEIDDNLLEEIQKNPKIASYFDIPIQHISTTLLKKMLRRGSGEEIKLLFAKIKSMIPRAVFRTTLIVGFPGETEQDFQELVSFVKKEEFDRLGVFAYSKEEDTVAFDYQDQIDEETKQIRLNEIMKIQKKIARKKNREEVGHIHETIVEAYDPESLFYYGRSYAFAPDDIDGYIVFQSLVDLAIGDIVKVKIKDSFGYDLIGDAILESEE
jgi:ribosomal protein S12 methylthiotransferase